MNKYLKLSFLFFLLSLPLINAKVKYAAENQRMQSFLEQFRNQFENRYNLNCSGECLYYKKATDNSVWLRVQERKTFLRFITITYEDEYKLDSDGNIIEYKYNFWSRLFNKNKLKGGQNG